MGVEKLILVANPGSASRKYALFSGDELLARLHFEYENEKVACQLITKNESVRLKIDETDIAKSVNKLPDILKTHKIMDNSQSIDRIGLRVVAPTSYFLEDRLMNEAAVRELNRQLSRAPLHISATLNEYEQLRSLFKKAEIIGISDSKFHVTKPDYAWNYGLPLDDADRLEIKRYGYHGISVSSVVRQLKDAGKLTPKIIVCHLGSGASITAVQNGKSYDSSMGYSPLEGVIMSTRSGSIDYTAAEVMRRELGMDEAQFTDYLQHKSGLLGLSGISDDIRQLLKAVEQGEHRAKLALETYVYSIQKTIGQMAGALNGVDLLVFSGTVGERSAKIRSYITRRLDYLDFQLDSESNLKCKSPDEPFCISKLAQSKPVFVVSTDESAEIARSVRKF